MLESHTVGYEDATGHYLNGNRTSDSFTLVGPDSSAPCDSSACTASYAYDPRERLITEADGHGGATSFTLDPAGNVVREVVTGPQTATRDFTYVGQQLRTVSEGTDLTRYFYDSEGNLDCATTTAGSQSSCAVPEGGSASPSLLSDYAYDYLNRLTSVRGFANGVEMDESTYTHDALDRPVEQEERHGAGGSPRTTLFSYVGLSTMVSSERHENASGSLLTTKSYAYDPFGRRLAMTGAPAGQAAETCTYGHDVHGSVSLLLAPNGQARAAYGYSAYGGADSALSKGDSSSTDPVNSYRYTGKRQDSGSGTLDMGARRFFPDVGRFLQIDVFHGARQNQWLGADPINQNRYSLASGNPVNYHETDGHVMQYDGGPDVSQPGGGPAPTPPTRPGSGPTSSGGAAGGATGPQANDPGGSAGACGVVALDCSLSVFESATWEWRVAWLERLQHHWRLGGWFNAILGILDYFGSENSLLHNSDKAKVADGGVLWVIQEGLAAVEKNRVIRGDSSPHARAKWASFFQGLRDGADDDVLTRRWGVAEAAGVEFGMWRARSIDCSRYEDGVWLFFLAAGGWFRSIASNGLVDGSPRTRRGLVSLGAHALQVYGVSYAQRNLGGPKVIC